MLIVIPWRDRTGYLSITLSTLMEAMRGHDDVRIWLFNNESKNEYPPIVYDMIHKYGDRFKIIYLHGENCHHVFIDMFNYAFKTSEEKHIVNIDSDCCIHPSFIKAAKRMIVDLPNLGHASLYSEGSHPEPTEVVNRIYHQRGHISMTASVISRAAWEAFPKPALCDEIRFGCIDGAFSTFVHEQFKACYSTIRSYVEHIGAVGVYSHLTDDGASSCHRARRFLWED